MSVARLVRLAVLLGCAGLGAVPLAAQDTAADSLRRYDLGEIVVQDIETLPAVPSTVQRIGLAEVARLATTSVAELGRLIPAAHVQTNSRGETLLYLRGHGERQVAYFFDGALLNVPWDHRVDLAMVPSAVVGGMTVARGVPSVLYGPNTAGGAVNLTSRRAADEVFTEAAFHARTPSEVGGHAAHFGSIGRWQFGTAGGFATRAGLAVPADAHLPFNQAGRLRTNSDRSVGHVFARLARMAATGESLALTVLHVSGSQGVPPEGHLDPAVARVRYWRYPRWQHSMLIGSAIRDVGAGRLHATTWGGFFHQRIAQFERADYEVRSGRQDDRDATAGARMVFAMPAGATTVRLAANGLVSRHRQHEASVETAPLVRRFALGQGSLGLEVAAPVGAAARLQGGMAVEGSSQSADDVSGPVATFRGVSGTLGGVLQRGTATFRGAGGFRPRFPTLRERFDDALGKFLLNPNLQPERTTAAEAAAAVSGTQGTAELVLFASRTVDAITQEGVIGAPGVRRRVNLDRRQIVGLELVAAYRPAPGWRAGGHLTLQRGRGWRAGERQPLLETPSLLSTISLARIRARGFSYSGQAVVTAGARGLDGVGAAIGLPTAAVLDVQLTYRLRVGGTAVTLRAFARNLTDASRLPQPGLPEEGRSGGGGVDVLF